MKFLFIAAGRRNQFAKYLNRLGVEIDSYELDVNCPIKLDCANVIPGKRWSDPGIEDEIKTLSANYDLVIPFHDKATKILADLNIDNTCISSSDTAFTCLNKKQFETFFLGDPELSKYYPRDDGGEVVLKPSEGVSAQGVLFCDESPKNVPDDFVVQKRITGTEYTLDCFYDNDFSLVDFVPRQRVRVVDGEVVESATTNKDKFVDVVRLLSSKFRFRGPVCFQFIEDDNQNLWIIEINARMGGGCTLSIASGLDIPSLLISVFCTKDFVREEYVSNWKENFYLKRYLLDYCYEKICI